MFDDCNTFFKGKPDGRDAFRAGVPCGCENATPDTRVGWSRSLPLRNSYTPLIPAAHGIRHRKHVPKFRGHGPRTMLWADRGFRERPGTVPCRLRGRDRKRTSSLSRRSSLEWRAAGRTAAEGTNAERLACDRRSGRSELRAGAPPPFCAEGEGRCASGCRGVPRGGDRQRSRVAAQDLHSVVAYRAGRPMRPSRAFRGA